MNKTGTIYKIENLANGKVYIGQTYNEPRRRWADHLSRLRRNCHENIYLQNSWNKYGEENFVFEIVVECDIALLDKFEVSLIKNFKAEGRSMNIEGGGKEGKTLDEITKIKLSRAVKKLHRSDDKYRMKYLSAVARKVICINTGEVFESIVSASIRMNINYANISQCCLGRNKVAMGNDGVYYQFSYYYEDTNYKLADHEVKMKPRRVRCVNTGEVFESAHQASKAMGLSQGKICLCCKGHRKHTGKMENGDLIAWVFEEDFNPNQEYTFKKTGVKSEETRKKISEANKGKNNLNKRYKSIDKYQNQIEFSSANEVIKHLERLGFRKSSIDNIQRCCNGKRKTAYKHQWEYV